MGSEKIRWLRVISANFSIYYFLNQKILEVSVGFVKAKANNHYIPFV